MRWRRLQSKVEMDCPGCPFCLTKAALHTEPLDPFSTARNQPLNRDLHDSASSYLSHNFSPSKAQKPSSPVQFSTLTDPIFPITSHPIPSLTFKPPLPINTHPLPCHQILNQVHQKSERQKQSTAGIRWWSPTQLLASRYGALEPVIGREPLFSTFYGRLRR